MSFQQKIIGSKNDDIFLVISNDRELPCYHYVRVDKKKLPHFKSLTGNKVELTDFGEILESGYGAPNDAIRKKMEKKYGFIEA